MLVSKRDLAKYPFTVETAQYVKNIGLKVDDLDSPDYTQIVDRAEQRIEEAILSGIVEWKDTPSYDVEILSFPVSMVLISAIGNAFLKKKYALAEAKKVYSLLRNETNDEKLVDIATASFGWKIKRASPIVGQTYDFVLSFADYLKNASGFHDDKWKLVNRVMVEGDVYLKRDELARLIEEEVRTHIQEKFKTGTEIEFPPQLAQRANRISQLLAEHRGEVQFEGFPPKTIGAAYPPCVKKLYDAVLASQHISHVGRFTLTSFLINVGVSVDELMKLYASTTDFDERLTRYQVEHIAGERGSRTKYTPPNCDTLRTHGLCRGADDLCRTIRHPLTYYRRKLRLIKAGKAAEEGE